MTKQTKDDLKQLDGALVDQGLIDLTAMSDEQLLHTYRQDRDPGVFTELVSRYQRELYNYLRRFLGRGAR